MTDVIIEADGGARGNPGPAGYGSVVRDASTGDVLAERAEAIGETTNNVAEYRGLIAGLKAARELGATHVTVRMDSKLVVEQMSGRWQVKHAAMRPLHREASDLARGFAAISYEWVPRAQNAAADRLANLAMDGAAPAPSRPTTWVPPDSPPTRLVLVRHGSTAHSAAHRFSGRNDLPLNDVGRQQAAALAARSFGAVDAIVSSPLPRAVQTAEAIAAPLGLPVEIVDDLIELDFGAWEGLTLGEIRERDAKVLEAWLASEEVAPPGGESFAVVGARVRRAHEAIVAAHPEQTVVAVSHVTPIKFLLRFALDAPRQTMYRVHLDTAAVSVVDYYHNGAVSVRLVNDTSHLLR